MTPETAIAANRAMVFFADKISRRRVNLNRIKYSTRLIISDWVETTCQKKISHRAVSYAPHTAVRTSASSD